MASLTTNKFKELLALQVINFQTHTFKAILMQPGFSFSRASHETYADVILYERATGFGYTKGGLILSGVSIVKSNIHNAALITWNNPSWLAAVGNLETDGAIIFDDTVASPIIDPIIGYIDFNSVITTYPGGTFTILNPTVAIR